MNQDPPAAQQHPANIAQQRPVEPELPPQQQRNDENAILPFMQGLLNKTARTPEKRRYQQQVASAQKLIEQYKDKPAAKLDPTGERASKRTSQQLQVQIDQTIGLEVNKKSTKEKKQRDKDLEFEVELCKLSVNAQRAFAAAITSLAVGDQQSATMWKFVSHYLNRIIAGDAQPKREAALMPDSLKGLVSGTTNRVDIFGQKTIDNIKEKTKTAKLIQKHTEKEQTVSQPQTRQNDQPLIAVPLTMSQQQLQQQQQQTQQQPFSQFLAFPFSLSFQQGFQDSQQSRGFNSNYNQNRWQCRGGPYKRDRNGQITVIQLQLELKLIKQLIIRRITFSNITTKTEMSETGDRGEIIGKIERFYR
ncbi:MAG: hypothetical protein EZS28_008286 [Streblomastix strix]|uniref:Uncharacterized protein n=1 Tax=Streblomastix strix TaxID=222440 RepID=A0A5J4WPW9_9EUKA|nr:MAG: hypothetical protein EZS28_008286 [Streblomastix strix]